MEKSLENNSFFNIIYNLANILFPLITSMYVSRALLTDGIGRVVYSQNIASYFVMLASLGLPAYGVREIAKCGNCDEKTNKLFTELLLINACVTVLAVIAYAALVFCNTRFRANCLLFLCSGITIFMNFFNIDWFYQGKEEYRYISLRSVFVKIVSLVMVIVFVKKASDYIKYVFISSLAVTLNYMFNIVHIRKFVRLDFHDIRLKRHFAPLAVLALSAFLASAYSKIDVTMLGSMSTENAIGLYSNAHKITEIIIVMCSSISAVFLPRLSYCYEHNKEDFYNLIHFGIKVLGFIAFPCTVGLFIIAPEILVLFFGKSFLGASAVLRIFSILIVIKSFGNLLCYQLVIATGNERKRLPAYFAAAILNIGFNACLIPKMAQNGAAIASVISELAVNGIQLFSICKVVRLPLPSKELTQDIISTGVMGMIVFAIKHLIVSPLPVVIICVMAGIISYAGANVIIKNEMIISCRTMICRRLRRRKEPM